MAIWVIDTNVWVMLDAVTRIDQLDRDCAVNCVYWMKSIMESDDQIAVDVMMKILTKYRANIKNGGLAQQYLNQLLTQPITRLKFREIKYDSDGYAIIPDGLFEDEDDRKFIAVALTFDPPPPIINATDTDWGKEREKLVQAKITITELCPAYIKAKMRT